MGCRQAETQPNGRENSLSGSLVRVVGAVALALFLTGAYWPLESFFATSASGGMSPGGGNAPLRVLGRGWPGANGVMPALGRESHEETSVVTRPAPSMRGITHEPAGLRLGAASVFHAVRPDQVRGFRPAIRYPLRLGGADGEEAPFHSH